MSLAIIANNGQLVLPPEIREYLNVEKGDKLDFSIDEEGKVVVTPKTMKVDDLYGMIKKKKRVTLKQMKQGITEYLRDKVKHARH